MPKQLGGIVHQYTENSFDSQKMELRTLEAWAADIGVAADDLVEISQICGKWWITTPRQQLRGRDFDDIKWYIETNLPGKLSENTSCECTASVTIEPVLPTIAPLVEEIQPESPIIKFRTEDIKRITSLINENLQPMQNVKWHWLVGEVFQLIADSKPTMKVIQERGILLSDIGAGIKNVHQYAHLVPSHGLLPKLAISEMRRMHKIRSGFLKLDCSDSSNPLVSGTSKKSKSTTKIDAPSKTTPYAVGEIVWVTLQETKNGRKSLKKHPALLLGQTGSKNGKWTLVSFTSEVEGSPHHRCISNYADLGLDHSSYVWHECQKVHKSQIVSHIGWVNHDLIRVVRSGVDVRQVTISKLVEIADTHHSEYQDTTSAAWV